MGPVAQHRIYALPSSALQEFDAWVSRYRSLATDPPNALASYLDRGADRPRQVQEEGSA